ncbi:unnamed protein product [Cuscuta campestris]|uniref:Uncharacterized protein n=1 Tax=Cuscuta campestris TaxID=132261 RepID=A0A484MH07_9ASTE|nr:unnamed protein product [Cuscuta campestris]
MVCTVSIGQKKCAKLTREGVHVMRGLVAAIENEVDQANIREVIRLDDVEVNDMRVNWKENDNILIVNATDSQCDNLLRSFIDLTHHLCESKIGLVPDDLKHLLRYLSKVGRVRESHEFIMHHPALWNEIFVEKMVLSLDIDNSVSVPKQFTKSFSWKTEFENLVIKNPALNQNGFYVAIKKIWTNTTHGFKCSDDIGGFLHFMRNIFTHFYDQLTGNIKYLTKSHQASAIWEFMHAFKPDFLCLLYSSIFYDPNFRRYFTPLM